MSDATVEDEDAEETAEGTGDEDASNWYPKAAATVPTTRVPAAQILRLRIRRDIARARLLEVTPALKAGWCCRRVSVFRYADDMRRL